MALAQAFAREPRSADGAWGCAPARAGREASAARTASRAPTTSNTMPTQSAPTSLSEAPFAYVDLCFNAVLAVAEAGLAWLFGELGGGGERADASAVRLRALAALWDEREAAYRQRDPCFDATSLTRLCNVSTSGRAAIMRIAQGPSPAPTMM
jgi:hypothetical protein